MSWIYVAVYGPENGIDTIDTIERFASEIEAASWCAGFYEAAERFCGATWTRRWPEAPSEDDAEDAQALLADLLQVRDDEGLVASRTGATVAELIEAMTAREVTP